MAARVVDYDEKAAEALCAYAPWSWIYSQERMPNLTMYEPYDGEYMHNACKILQEYFMRRIMSDTSLILGALVYLLHPQTGNVMRAKNYIYLTNGAYSNAAVDRVLNTLTLAHDTYTTAIAANGGDIQAAKRETRVAIHVIFQWQ